MKDTTKRAKTLGFTNLESLLYDALTSDPQGVVGLANSVDRPHTSLYRPLAALKNRGLVEEVRHGSRSRWRKVAQESLISSLGSVLFTGLTATNTGQPLHPEFFLHTGRDALVQIYFSISEQKKIRFSGIQPNKSIAATLDVLTTEELIRINSNIKKNEIIVEALLQEDVVSFYAAELKKRGMPEKKIFESFGGRAADTTYVPKEYINFNSEIIFLPKVAYIIDWASLTAVEVRNRETVGLIRDLFALAKSFGTKTDQNKLLREFSS
ncbi:MAG: helix-turn-helix domain-containing protein [Patescibacteria group bacterium]